MMNIDQIYKLYQQTYTVTTDTRQIYLANPCLFFALKGPNFNGNQYAKEAIERGALAAFVDEPAFVDESNRIYYTKNSLECLQQLAVYHRKRLKIPVVGLTGSNGKTTTKELMASVLSQKFNIQYTKGNLNNEIGVPLSLLSIKPTHQIAVVEMGANHLGEIAFLSNLCLPNIGYVTNFGSAHLEGFGSLEGVVLAKSELYDYLKENHQTVLINVDDFKQVEQSAQIEKQFTFSTTEKPCDCKVEWQQGDSLKDYISLHYAGLDIHSQLVGMYNTNNICAAIAVGQYFGMLPASIKKGVEKYMPSNNRSQIIIKEDKYILLDAYNANPSSMQAAISYFFEKPNSLAILGDMFELGQETQEQHTLIAQQAQQVFEQVYLVGENFFAVKNISAEKVKQFIDNDQLIEYLKKFEVEQKHILIKGSRSMAMENIEKYI